jgi:hypothetical protein
MRVDWPAVARIEQGAFHHRHADAADHPAGALTQGQARIDDAADAIDADRAAHPDRARIGIDRDLAEDRAESMHGVAPLHLVIAPRRGRRLDRLARTRGDVAVGLAR